MKAIPFVKMDTHEYDMIDISDVDKNITLHSLAVLNGMIPAEHLYRLQTSDGKPIDNVKVSEWLEGMPMVVHIVLNLIDETD